MGVGARTSHNDALYRGTKFLSTVHLHLYRFTGRVQHSGDNIRLPVEPHQLTSRLRYPFLRGFEQLIS